MGFYRIANPFFRAVLFVALCVLPLSQGAWAADHQRDPATYTWQPELSPHGPVVISVCLKTQTAAVYRNGIRIGTCRVSTGRPGHKTPTGVFYILNKDIHHRSKKYNNAPMPYSERLTWDGIALHAGYIPTKPGTSSHGCIHLPYKFAQKLFSLTSKGTTVVISDDVPDIFVSKNHRIGFRGGKESEYVWNPHYSDHGPVSLIYSQKEKKLFILRNGIVIGEAPVETSVWSKHVTGTAAFIFTGWVKKRGKVTSTWIQISGKKAQHVDRLDEWFKLDPLVVNVLRGLLVKGTNLIVTSEGVSDRTYSSRAFPLIDGLKEAKGQLKIKSFKQLDK